MLHARSDQPHPDPLQVSKGVTYWNEFTLGRYSHPGRRGPTPPRVPASEARSLSGVLPVCALRAPHSYNGCTNVFCLEGLCGPSTAPRSRDPARHGCARQEVGSPLLREALGPEGRLHAEAVGARRPAQSAVVHCSMSHTTTAAGDTPSCLCASPAPPHSARAPAPGPAPLTAPGTDPPPPPPPPDK